MGKVLPIVSGTNCHLRLRTLIAEHRSSEDVGYPEPQDGRFRRREQAIAGANTNVGLPLAVRLRPRAAAQSRCVIDEQLLAQTAPADNGGSA